MQEGGIRNNGFETWDKFYTVNLDEMHKNEMNT